MIATADPVQVQSPAQPCPKISIIETLRKTVSASRLNCWLTCRLKFYFRHVAQIPKPPIPSLHVGSIVHLVLQAWSMAGWRAKQPVTGRQHQAHGGQTGKSCGNQLMD